MLLLEEEEEEEEEEGIRPVGFGLFSAVSAGQGCCCLLSVGVGGVYYLRYLVVDKGI